MKTILLVEDDPLISHNITRSLAQAGYRPVAARTLEKGYLLSRLESYDLLLLDIGLPDGSGLELAQRLRREAHQSPIIFLTAYEDEHVVSQAIACGAYSYLVKPVAANQLLPLIATALASLERQAAQTQTLVSAIDKSRTVSTAIGMLAERKRWTTDAAFEALRRWSRRNEVKIEVVAKKFVDGDLNADHF